MTTHPSFAHAPQKICLLLFLGIAGILPAQTKKGDHVLTIGTFGSMVEDIHEIPVFVHYDYSLGDHFSLGPGYARCTVPYYREHLYRHSFGLRALYHFDTRFPNWDLYSGLQAGVNYWTSGAYPDGTKLGMQVNRVFPLLDIPIGGFTPSGQGLLGARYHFYNWFGISSEIAVGTPYFFSIGLSANLSNTRSGFGNMREDYRAALAPVATKNVLKLNTSSLVLVPGIAYERHLGNRFTLELGGSFRFENAPLQLGESAEMTGVYTESDSLGQVLKAYGLVKYYITAQQHPVPQGWYLGAVYQYTRASTTVHVTDLQVSNGIGNYDYKKETEQQGGGPVLGYQWFFAEHFTLDIFGGIQAGSARLLSMRYADPSVTEEDFRAHFGSHVLDVQPAHQPWIFKASVGYAF